MNDNENVDVPLNRLKEGLRGLALLQIDELIDRPALGPFNFSKYRRTFEEIIEFAGLLLDLELDDLELNRIEALVAAGDNVATTLEKIRGFKPDKVDNPAAVRDSNGQNLKDNFINFVNVARHDLPYLLLKRKPIDEEEFDEKLKDADEILVKLQDMEGQMATILEASRTAAGQIGVDAHSVDFSVLAGEHKDTAKNWLFGVIGLVLLAVLFPVLFVTWFPLEGDWSSIGNIQKFVTKVAILFILYFLIAQATKNYRTHRHLYVVNKHRETSLKTFRTFVESAEADPGVKMQILLEASRTIFAPSHTGYIANEEENPNSRIVEIMKMVKDSKP